MTYKIDDFEINQGLREIYLRGQRINVEPKVYELIVFLIQNANKAISKDELQDAIWPLLEVSETAITRAIMKSRKTLNDASNPINYIQTVHGFGYKFIAEIIVDKPDKNTSELPQYSDSPPKKTKANSVIIFLVLLSLIAVGIVYIFQNKNPLSSGDLIVLPIENKIENSDYSWVSFGLMSLASKVIESKSNVGTLPDQDSISVYEHLNKKSYPLTNKQVEDVFERFDVNYIVSSLFSQRSENSYELNYTVHHKNGVYSGSPLTGTNPTELAQKMSNQVANFLPGKISKVRKIVISKDVFTNELYSRGRSFQLMGNADKAQKYFELASQQDELLFSPRYELAIVKRKQNKLKEAKADFEDLLKNLTKYSDDPTDKALILNALGITHLRLLDHDSAKQNFLESYELAKLHKMHSYQVSAAYNLGLLHKRVKDFKEAKSRALESLMLRKKHNLVGGHYDKYLLGQIERDTGNLDKAEKLFNEAYQGYVDAGETRHASTVLSGIASLLKRLGKYEEALAKLEEAKELKLKLNHVIGLADVYLVTIDIYKQIGDTSTGRKLVNELKQYIEENEIDSRKTDLLKTEIALDFSDGLYEQVIEKINNEAKNIKSRNLDMFKLKSLQHLGDDQVIKEWLANNLSLKTGSNSMMRMYWIELESVYLESHGNKQDLINSYQQRLELSRLMGYDAFTIKILLKLGRTYLDYNQIDEAKRVLNEIFAFDLNWWQIKTFEALLLNAKGKPELATELMIQAKKQAKKAWKQNNESDFQSIING